MMNLKDKIRSRRSFLAGAGTVGAASVFVKFKSLFSTSIDGAYADAKKDLSPEVPVTVVIRMYSLSSREADNMVKVDWEDSETIKGINDKYLASGAIRSIDFDHNKDTNILRWEYDIKDLASYEQWRNEVMRYGDVKIPHTRFFEVKTAADGQRRLYEYVYGSESLMAWATV